jgi:hypothetical protein
MLLQNITLLSNIYLSNCKKWSLSTKPFLIIISIINTIFISSCSKIYFLSQTFKLLCLIFIIGSRDSRTFQGLIDLCIERIRVYWWTPCTARDKMIWSKWPIKLIKIWLAKVFKCIEPLLNFLSVYHFKIYM